MGKCRQIATKEDKRSTPWRVVDDFVGDLAVEPAELDAIEAFLMPALAELMRSERASQKSSSQALHDTGSDSQSPQTSAVY